MANHPTYNFDLEIPAWQTAPDGRQLSLYFETRVVEHAVRPETGDWYTLTIDGLVLADPNDAAYPVRTISPTPEEYDTLMDFAARETGYDFHLYPKVMDRQTEAKPVIDQ